MNAASGASDPRFVSDPIIINELLREIKAELEFDPHKTELDKAVIGEIYSKYFNTDVFKQLNAINNDSQQYILSGNYNYVPTPNKSEFDIQKYQKLQTDHSIGIGINGGNDGNDNDIKK